MNKLKLIVTVFTMAMLVQRTMATEPVIGLYLSQHDFLNHTLSFSTGGRSGNSVHLNNYFGMNTITVVHEGKRQLLSKKEIFGYRIDTQDFRYFNSLPFHILECKNIFIYSRADLIQEGKGPKTRERFYFSLDAAAPVMALSIENIQRAYSKNRKFTNAVESLFSSDEKLSAFDASNHEFRISYLYAENQ